VAQTADGLQSLVTRLLASPLWANPQVRRLFRSGNWILVLSGLSLLVFVDGRLVLSLGAGVTMMALVYLSQDGHWKLPEAKLEKLWETVNQPLVLSAAGGAAAMLGTYLAASMWAEATSPAVATGAVLQGFGTLVTLLLLSGNWVGRRQQQARADYAQALQDLTASDALKRLIAVRQLGNVATEQPNRIAEISDYCYLLLQREPEATVRDAAMDVLQQIGQQLGQPPLPRDRPRQDNAPRQESHPAPSNSQLDVDRDADRLAPPSLKLQPKHPRELVYEEPRHSQWDVRSEVNTCLEP
jgi:hypothetical protein